MRSTGSDQFRPEQNSPSALQPALDSLAAAADLFDRLLYCCLRPAGFLRLVSDLIILSTRYTGSVLFAAPARPFLRHDTPLPVTFHWHNPWYPDEFPCNSKAGCQRGAFHLCLCGSGICCQTPLPFRSCAATPSWHQVARYAVSELMPNVCAFCVGHKRQRQSKDPGISPAGAFSTHRLVARLRQIGRRAASQLLYAHFARRSFGTPTMPPSVGFGGLGAPPRRGRIAAELVFF